MTARWPYPRWIAHRGAGRLAPENTLAALRLGAAQGYRMFECDAQLSRDGVPFLMHDATLERTTGGRGIGGDHDWAELAQLDAGGWHSPAFVGEPLARLEDAARFCIANGHCLNIEIKPAPGTQHRTGEQVARTAERLWRDEAVKPLLSSFQVDSLAAALAAAPALPRAWLLDDWRDDWLRTARRLRCAAVVCHHRLWDRASVRQAHQAGLCALSYTVNDKGMARRLLALGIDGIITDRVDLFHPAG